MTSNNQAIVLKYDVSDILNALSNIPSVLNGSMVDPGHVVDVFILNALNSFQICSFYPSLPPITDPVFMDWCNLNVKAYRAVWSTIKIPPQCSGWEAAYLRCNNTVWIHYIYKGTHRP